VIPPPSAPNADVPAPFSQSGYMLTTLNKVIGWFQSYSVWPLTSGLACCAIEMMSASMSRFDISRFGSEVFRASPRQADLLIVSGRMSWKMAPVVRELYDQMPFPKWVISMGACASCGGVFRTYSIVHGVDHIFPVDLYIPGCPPRPEALLDALVKLQKKVRTGSYVSPTVLEGRK
jgi:NADH-quinone oxidoreductase subunit B